MYRSPEAEEGNRTHWDELAQVHYKSYDIDTLLNGGHVMDQLQVKELGDVTSRSMLHLQCHIGTDTLSWARLGASVTGVDISGESIRVAKDLAKRTGLPAKFLRSSIYDLPEVLNERFDIVYTSVGVLCWLSDLDQWGSIIRKFLNPGGIFYIMETHPFLMVFDDESTDLNVRYRYFHSREPIRWEGEYPDYSDGDYTVKSPSWEWQWGLQDVVQALLKNGMTLEFLREHPVISWKALPCMVPAEEKGFWRIPKDPLPLSFSIRARATE